jgi:Ca2+-binding RTX toxin-like protein
VTIAADGGFTYRPPAETSGTDSFAYRVTDGFGGADRGRVVIEVAPVADAPVAQDDRFAGSATGVVTGNLLAANGRGADSDADGDALSVLPGRFLTAGGGLVEIAADGGFSYRNLDGQPGTDSFAYTLRDATGRTDTGQALLTLAAPAGALPGTAGDDAPGGTAGADLLLGLGGDDRITAGDGGDTVFGGAGNDRVEAGRGGDLLLGGRGNDRLEGEAGNDTLIGGAGADLLDGEVGADRFVFLLPGEGLDVIADFTPAEGDVLDLAGLLAGIADPLAALRLRAAGRDAVLEADTGGGFVPVVTLAGGAGLPDLAALATSGALVIA